MKDSHRQAAALTAISRTGRLTCANLSCRGNTLTPLLVGRITNAGVAARSFKRAAMVMNPAAGQHVSTKTIERVVLDIGGELARRRNADPQTADALAQRPEGPPALAVVEWDGGRIRTREPGHGLGVHHSQ